MIIEVLLGIQCAVLIILLSSRWHLKAQFRFWSAGLVIAALIYIGFTLYNSAWDQLTKELGGVVVYGILAILGYRYNPIILVIGWGLHVLWDMLVHFPMSKIAPPWYPGACLGFDIIIAIYLGYLIWGNPNRLKLKKRLQ